MRYLIIIALIAQLAARLCLALPINLAHSNPTSQDKAINSGDVPLKRRGGSGSGFFRPWGSKTISSDTVIKVSPEPISAPIQPLPAPITATKPKVNAAQDYPQLKSKEKSRMMANAHGTRAKSEVAAGARGSYKSVKLATAEMGKHSMKAVQQFGMGNGRQGMQHVRNAGRMGGMAATYGTVPLVNGLASGARSGGTAMKYKVKQWTTSSNRPSSGDTAAIFKYADQVKKSTPGMTSSRNLLKKMWGPKKPIVPVRRPPPVYLGAEYKPGSLGTPQKLRDPGPPPPRYQRKESDFIYPKQDIYSIREIPSPPPPPRPASVPPKILNDHLKSTSP